MQLQSMGPCTHFVWQVSATLIIADPIALADAPCERALGTRQTQFDDDKYKITKFKLIFYHLFLVFK